MPLPDNIELELYVATNKFRDKGQYEESQEVLRFINRHGVRDRFEITPLEELVGNKDIFWLRSDPEKGKLPYLEYTHRGTGLISEYMGKVEIIELLEELGLRQKNGNEL